MRITNYRPRSGWVAALAMSVIPVIILFSYLLMDMNTNMKIDMGMDNMVSLDAAYSGSSMHLQKVIALRMILS
jgi:hypothetical protein